MKITKARVNVPRRIFDRDNLLAPFDKYLDNLFNSIYADTDQAFIFGDHPFTSSAYPKVNVYDYSDRIEIISELAGYEKGDIDVSIADGVLSISGKSSKEKEEESGNGAVVVIKELKRSKFSRSFSLGENLDENSINAEYKDGLLSIVIKKKIEVPKVEAVKKVEIK